MNFTSDDVQVNSEFLEKQNETSNLSEVETSLENEQYFQLFKYDFSRSFNSLCSTKKLFNHTVLESINKFCKSHVNPKESNYIPNGSEDNFFKVAKWSPDGTCILTSSNDNLLRIFELPTNIFEIEKECDLTPALSYHQGDTVYDCCWYPMMSSQVESILCDYGTRLQEKASYTIINHREQIVGPNSLSFNLDGSKIYCGFKNMVQIFDTTRPNFEGDKCPTTPTRKSKEGQKGIISSITFNPDRSGLYAAGSYSQTIGLYDENNNELLYLFKGNKDDPFDGITQLQFSLDGKYLFSASRRDNYIRCWDIRNTGEVLYKLYRKGETNQRILFDIDNSGGFLVTGDQDGEIIFYDLANPDEKNMTRLNLQMNGHKDLISTTTFHPYFPLLASCSGQRRFEFFDDTFYCNKSTNQKDILIDKDQEKFLDNSLKIWKIEGNYECYLYNTIEPQ
ncbi:14200_t:CDS:10 [Entrophospora sp. SA101]|nr:14200_t:CDS:10 [Entrophospora sp. SA101]CAJ0897715.1 2839_t:CDS:10 [Entrophospora sp. SA101]